MKIFFSAVLTIVTIISANLYAENPCIVTKTSGKAVGSIHHATLYCEGIITFDVKSVTVAEPIVFHMNDNVEIEGQNNVTIKGDGFSDVLLVSAIDGLKVKNIILDFIGDACVVITGFDSQVLNTTLLNCDGGLVVLSGDNNELTQNDFINTLIPIVLEDEGNINISEPTLLTAKNFDDSNWELKGSSWSNNISRLEVYVEKTDEIYYLSTNNLENITVSDNNFSVLMNFDEYSPYLMYHFLFIDKDFNTSALSGVLTPVKEEGFIPPDNNTTEEDENNTPQDETTDETTDDTEKDPDPSTSKTSNSSGGCSLLNNNQLNLSSSTLIIFILSFIFIRTFKNREN